MRRLGGGGLSEKNTLPTAPPYIYVVYIADLGRPQRGSPTLSPASRACASIITTTIQYILRRLLTLQLILLVITIMFIYLYLSKIYSIYSYLLLLLLLISKLYILLILLCLYLLCILIIINTYTNTKYYILIPSIFPSSITPLQSPLFLPPASMSTYAYAYVRVCAQVCVYTRVHVCACYIYLLLRSIYI